MSSTVVLPASGYRLAEVGRNIVGLAGPDDEYHEESADPGSLVVGCFSSGDGRGNRFAVIFGGRGSGPGGGLPSVSAVSKSALEFTPIPLGEHHWVVEVTADIDEIDVADGRSQMRVRVRALRLVASRRTGCTHRRRRTRVSTPSNASCVAWVK